MGGKGRSVRAAAVCALVAAALAVVLIARGSGGYELTAVFEQAYGLPVGANVQAGGVKVGEVEEISLDSGDRALVRMRIDADFRPRRGAIADLRQFSNSGELNRFVELTEGNGPALPDGARIGLAHTDQPVELDQVWETLDPPTRADLRAVLARLDRSFRGRGPDIDRALRHSAEALGQTADLAADIGADGEALRRLLREGRAVLGAVSSSPGELGEFADHLGGMLETTAGRERELVAQAELMEAGLRSPRLALERLDAQVENLRELVAAGRPGARELVPFANELRPFVQRARPALAEARELLVDAPADLRRLNALNATAEPVFGRSASALSQANPMLNHLRVNSPEVVQFFALWGDMSANYDANGHAARTSIIVDNPPAREVGPAERAAGFLARPFNRFPGVLEGEPWLDYERSFVGEGTER